MGDVARCRYCGQWVFAPEAVTITVTVTQVDRRPIREVIHLHTGSCLDRWAPTSGSLLRHTTRTLVGWT